jgi:SAM-dependent methyltransferase
MSQNKAHDRWESGDPYEAYVGRWSRRVAPQFLAWLDAPSGLAWLDVGCGTGALIEAVLEDRAPSRLAGVDASAGFLALARQRLRAGGVELHEADAQALPFNDGEFDRVVSGLVLNFIPNPALAIAEMARVARRGGTVAVYVWDYAGGMEMMRYFWDAAAAVDPRAAELDEGRRFPICRPEALDRLFESNGAFGDIATHAIDVPTVFRDFDDYWTPFLGGQGPAPAYCASLADDTRAKLRERLRARLPESRGGRIDLKARAWAVRGRRL